MYAVDAAKKTLALLWHTSTTGEPANAHAQVFMHGKPRTWDALKPGMPVMVHFQTTFSRPPDTLGVRIGKRAGINRIDATPYSFVLRGIDAEKRTVTVGIRGTDLKFSPMRVDGVAKVSVDGRPAKLGELTEGMPAALEFAADEKGSVVVALRAEKAPAPKQPKDKDDPAPVGNASYEPGQVVRVRFFLKNTGTDPLTLVVPGAILHGHYTALRVFDPEGEKVPIQEPEGEMDLVGAMLLRLAPDQQTYLNGPAVGIGEGTASDSVKIVLRAKPGQTYRVQFALPNYGDPKAEDLKTGEFGFNVLEKGIPAPKPLTAEELQKHIAWGKPGKNGLQVGVVLAPPPEDDNTKKSKE